MLGNTALDASPRAEDADDQHCLSQEAQEDKEALPRLFALLDCFARLLLGGIAAGLASGPLSRPDCSARLLSAPPLSRLGRGHDAGQAPPSATAAMMPAHLSRRARRENASSFDHSFSLLQDSPLIADIMP